MVDFAETNRIALRRKEETTWGTTPTGAVFTNLNFTNENFKPTTNFVTSETIRSDANVSDITKVGGGAGGDFTFEMRYGEYDDLLAGALRSNWVTTVVSASIASAFFSGGAIESDTSALKDVKAGQFIRVGGATTSANNGDYYVSSVTTVGGGNYKLACNNASSGDAASFTSEVFAAGTTLKGKMLRNGTTRKSFSIEKEFSDISTFALYPGMRIGTMGLSFRSQQILTGTFGFTGKSEVNSSATVASTAAAAPTADVMNASGNVGRIWEGGQAITGIVFQEISLNLNNNPREQTQVGSDALAGIGLGTCTVEGSFTAYYQDNSLVTKYDNATGTLLRFQVNDADGNSYIIGIPKVRLTDQSRVAGGMNQDSLQNVSWGAIVNDDGTHAIQIDALDA